MTGFSHAFLSHAFERIRRVGTSSAVRAGAFVIGCLMLFIAASHVPEVGRESATWASMGVLAGSLTAATFGAMAFWVGARGIVARLIGTC
ncbi:hypothetical protein SAMN04488548_1341212 [Gordonia westfalica]|uniref:Uncharacterized protein n=1 Tax=Gordonia westfalica TaxID=158898 RepID=A0A1H2IJT6_9ACTN|nr:hypothetical protein SAMN04488548_1341212 [Gordonia westfalica]